MLQGGAPEKAMFDPTEAALLEAIREDPADLARWLVHADWLEEHGQADLAELIRIHREMEEPEVDPARRFQLDTRHAALLDANRQRWPVHELESHYRWRHEEGRRSGPVRITVDVEKYPDQAAVLSRVAPLVEVELNDSIREEDQSWIPEEAFGRLAACPALAGWTALYLKDMRYSPGGLAILLASPHLRRLRTLDMFESFHGDEVRPWLALPRWPPLTKLHLNGLQGDELTAELARSGHLRGLRELSLIYNEIGDAGAAALADCADLAGLTRLVLYGNEIGDAGALALARSPYLGGLEDLDIDSYGATELSDEVERALHARFGDRVRL
jgi:uncharacterized protein (TIGR02996 family)